jgi:RNA polymerase sigma factor (sigma-70 family)
MNFKIRKHSEDDQLIAGILGDPDRVWDWENKLYLKFRYLIKDAIWRHKLNEDDASMAYSDTILTIIEQVQKKRFEEKASLKTYICKVYLNKCIDRIRSNQTTKSGSGNMETLEEYLEVVPGNTRDIIQQLSEKYEVAVLQKKISAMDEKCKRIILAWGEGFHDEEIASELGYMSAAVAKTSRLRCLSKLKKMYNIAVTSTAI